MNSLSLSVTFDILILVDHLIGAEKLLRKFTLFYAIIYFYL